MFTGDLNLLHAFTQHLPRLWFWAIVVALMVTSAAVEAASPENDATGVEFFERRIRPIFVEHCNRCHGGDLNQPKGGLSIASREQLLHGGKRGPAIVPGEPDHSLLLQAVRHDLGVDLKMPKGRDRLSDQAIDDLTRWIELGAPWPKDAPAPGNSLEDESSGQWAFEPVRDRTIPEVDDRGWSQSPIDRFIFDRLQAEGLTPADKADRRKLIRRATFDLIGLPPTPDEVEGFLYDPNPGAFARVVDRLLSSPHYGERWARHWLDLVGYAETDGNEYDPDKPDAFRYRDYVIEALNIDLPYDTFLREHIAGDLVEPPRLNLDGSQLASPVATTFYWLGDVQNVPVDEALAVANQVERQIDVIGKGFLGLTLACARCHDHKFDPISTEEYYGLAGFIYSSKRVHRSINAPFVNHSIDQVVAEIPGLLQEINALSTAATVDHLQKVLDKTAEYMMAATGLLREGQASNKKQVDRVARNAGLKSSTLQRWCKYLSEADTKANPIFYPWTRLVDQPPERIAHRAASLGESMKGAQEEVLGEMQGQQVFEDFEDEQGGNWRSIGPAFGDGFEHNAPPDVQGVQGFGYASSRKLGDVPTGRLLSDPVIVPKPYINYLIAGGDFPNRACLNVIVFGQRLSQLTATGDGTGKMRLMTFDIRNLIGREARFELVDEVSDPGGWIAVDQIFFSDDEPKLPYAPPNSVVGEFLQEPGLQDLTELAQRYEDALLNVLQRWKDQIKRDPASQRLTDSGQEELRRFVLGPQNPFMSSAEVIVDETSRERLTELRRHLKALEDKLPRTATALIAADDRPVDIPVQFSGQPGNSGDIVARGVPDCFGASSSMDSVQGSGRTELANRIASAENPFTARVIVNRLWNYHFGRGLVATPDNLGLQGELPSHPDLLDYLATRFIESGWSIKAMHRLMMLSATYQQGNQLSPEAERIDPNNRLLHHMPPRRLEAESVRDAILHVADNLNREMYGPSVQLYLTPYMEGRSLPEGSGPLDGDRRRSLYLELRRNHLPPMLTSFDFPKPDTTTGRRPNSALPTQALVMLNNEFVHQQAAAWAARVEELPDDQRLRVRHIYERALCREPDAEELDWAEAFFAHQVQQYEDQGDRVDVSRQLAWADLCHIMFNLAEFMYVR